MFLKKDRKLNRWQGYDYSFPGYYFVTICTYHRQPRFGEIVDNKMKLNEMGEIVKQQLLWLHDHFPHVRLDQWVIMPNHVHVILEINYNFNKDKTGYADDGNDGKSVGNGRDGKIFGEDFTVGNVLERSLQNNQHNSKILPLYRFIGAFKTTSSKIIHQQGHVDFKWQKSFYDRVIRNDEELSKIRDYILGNPAKWAEDKNNPNLLSDLRPADA